jgi:hypothetical protein
MGDLDETGDLRPLLEGLRIDAAEYFKQAAAENMEIVSLPSWSIHRLKRDEYWSQLPTELQDRAKRLYDRLISLMGQVADAVRTAQLCSEADRRDVGTAAKAMRAALLLRRFRSWNTEILNDEDRVLGVNPAGQSDDEPLPPLEAGETFEDWAGRIREILDLVVASPDRTPGSGLRLGEDVRYRPGTAFIMMWMDRSKPELIDLSDAVKEVFEKFDIRAVRADDIEHEGLITARVLSEIKTAEFCFADLTGGRPNVYYEVGYAHALPRRVILFRKAGTGLHFDLAGYNCPEYQNLHDLKEKLTNRLRVLTNKEPKS